VTVPADANDNFPVIETVGVSELPVNVDMLTPALSVTSSVTESLKNIVSPLDAAVNAEESVVWVPFAAEVATMNFAGP